MLNGLTNLGGGTATLRLLSATSRPFWAQATSRNAMKNCCGDQRCRVWCHFCDHMHLVRTKQTKRLYLLVERTFSFRVSQIPDLWTRIQFAYQHQHDQAGQQGWNANGLIWLFSHLPEDQVGQARPLQEQSCISRCHPPTACRIDLHTTVVRNVTETTITQLYCWESFQANSFKLQQLEKFQIHPHQAKWEQTIALWSSVWLT